MNVGHRFPLRVIALAVGLAAGTATQAGIVTTWDATLNATWTNHTPIDPGVTLSGDAKTLSWGTNLGSGQSSLAITDPAPASSVTTFVGGGAPPLVAPFLGSGISLTHTNNPIGSPVLTSAELTLNVTLTPTNPAGAALPSDTFIYNIAFAETPNGGTCAVSGSPTPCNDIFVMTTGLLNGSFSYDTDGAGGDPAQTYFVNIFPVSGGVLGILEPAACAAAGQPAGCIGLSTPEQQATTLAFGFTISTERLSVPEPATLALLGLGLAGLGVSQRRRLLR